MICNKIVQNTCWNIPEESGYNNSDDGFLHRVK